MSKQKASKLDQYAETLLEMDDQKKTLVEIQTWLKAEGVTASTGRLSEFLESLRSSRRETILLSQITSGARQTAEVEAAFQKNPAAELETLVKLHRVLILNLTTKGVANPEFLKLADQMTNTVLSFFSAKTKGAHKEREVTLAEAKAAEAKKTDGQKALEYCLAESKGTPAEELFKSAFAALKTARAIK